jgi:hypothetical protein
VVWQGQHLKAAIEPLFQIILAKTSCLMHILKRKHPLQMAAGVVRLIKKAGAV